MLGAEPSQQTGQAPAETTGPSVRECLRCKKAPARSPYLYCAACTASAHATLRQAQRRNALTKPPVKVYRWDTIKKDWVLKGTDEVTEP